MAKITIGVSGGGGSDSAGDRSPKFKPDPVVSRGGCGGYKQGLILGAHGIKADCLLDPYPNLGEEYRLKEGLEKLTAIEFNHRMNAVPDNAYRWNWIFPDKEKKNMKVTVEHTPQPERFDPFTLGIEIETEDQRIALLRFFDNPNVCQILREHLNEVWPGTPGEIRRILKREGK